MTVSDWGIPSLHPDRLATTIPIYTYAGGLVSDPAHTVFIWRTGSLSKARGMVLGFYVDDYRLEGLWRNPSHYTALFLRHGVVAAIEPDFSLWTDRPLAEQLFNVYRMRTLGRLYQEHGLAVIPNLAWSDERSFSFCFQGTPQHAPVVACECRTPGGNDDDRRAFLRGLTEGVKQVRPENVIIYGGTSHRYWLEDRLPFGPEYHLIDSWTEARGTIRARQARQAREKNQLKLFGGTNRWVDEVAAAEARNDGEAGRTKGPPEGSKAIPVGMNGHRNQPNNRQLITSEEAA